MKEGRGWEKERRAGKRKENGRIGEDVEYDGVFKTIKHKILNKT